ncbi:MAG: glutathione S-transferase family protein [Azospirillaceae bacterium]
MSQPILHGAPYSVYVRAVRLCLEEKSVSYQLVDIAPGSAAAVARHPYGKIPVFEHDGLTLTEAPAIAEYVDERFAGRPLRPETVAGRARMRQWVSVYADYVYPVAVRQVALPLFLAERDGAPTDPAAIARAAAAVPGLLAPLEAAIDRMTPYLAGAAPSIADFMLYPLLDMARRVAPLHGILDGLPRLADWRERMAARPSAAATAPG